jgi:hypothetical protein
LFLEPARAFLSAHEQALSSLGGGRRRFVLGIAAHVTGPEVPILLARLNAHDPCLTIKVFLSGGSSAVDAAVSAGLATSAFSRRLALLHRRDAASTCSFSTYPRRPSR